jgi:hypothetical protein
MKLHRIISRALAPTLALLLGPAVLLPPTALAGGPLLSGYGPPGAGAQSIIGATLLNGPGPGGGAGGGSSGGSAGGAGGGSQGGGSGGGLSSSSNGAAPSAGTHSAGGGGSRGGTGGHGVDAHPANGAGRSGGRSGTSAGRSGTYPSSSPFGASTAAAIGTAPWFSGDDLLALALAAGALALIAVTTVRLAGTHHD